MTKDKSRTLPARLRHTELQVQRAHLPRILPDNPFGTRRLGMGIETI